MLDPATDTICGEFTPGFRLVHPFYRFDLDFAQLVCHARRGGWWRSVKCSSYRRSCGCSIRKDAEAIDVLDNSYAWFE